MPTREKKTTRNALRAMAAAVAAMFVFMILPTTAFAKNEDLFLAAFMDRSVGASDYVYVSRDGKTFERLSVAYQDTDGTGRIDSGTTNPVYSLHDPGIGYKDGLFWMMSGFTTDEDGDWRFYPMFGSSRDLVNWTFPRKPDGVPATVSPAPDTKGKLSGGKFHCAGPDFMFDDNGDCWVVVPLGYYGDFDNPPHPQEDYMQPYICKISNLQRNPLNDRGDLGAAPTANAESFTRINLPVSSENWIDPSLYKENGIYYLSIKKDGVQNYVFAIGDLGDAGDPNAWTVVNKNVVTGYEGPCLTKGNGKYFYYTDKLVDYRDANGFGITGIYYQTSDSIARGWTWPQPINTIDVDGNVLPNRHGSVVRVDDPAAKELILSLRTSVGYTSFTDVIASKTPHAADIEWLAAAGISTGFNDYTFHPVSNIQRADMAAFLHRLADSWGVGPQDWQPKEEAVFTDVNPSTPHYKDILWLAEMGISTGYKDKTFRPSGLVVRQDMAAFLYRLAKLANLDLSGSAQFLDVTETTPHANEIGWLAAKGISKGFSGQTLFKPAGNVIRQDMAAFLQRLNKLYLDTKA